MEISSLSETIERLVVFGGATASPEVCAWLVSCGAARFAPGQTQWLVPTLSYLNSVLPARNRLDLVRKTAIRDSHYRLHLDLSMSRVIQIIARGERWPRFEELAFGFLRPHSQRLLALVEWVAERSEQTPGSLGEAHWNQFESEIRRDLAPEFRSWDNELWGQARDAADLFPLLEKLYLPLKDQPVHLALSGRQAQMMTLLIEAARADDGVSLSVDDVVVCDDLKRMGAPILRRSGTQLSWLVGRVELSVDDMQVTPAEQIQSVPLGVPTLAKRSRISFTAEETGWLKSSGPSAWTSETTFLSACPASETWPDTPVADAPAWSLVPDSSALTESALLRRVSGVEDSVIALDRHPLYGLLLQFFIAETLDRELGDETLLLAPSLDKAGAESEWGTTVLYRPSAKSESGPQSKSMGYLNLGSLDTVLNRIAQQLSLKILPLPYSRAGYGLWSWALHLLIDLKVVVGQRDRWTLSSVLHDCLYTGGLMAKVLRNRRETRQSIHQVLNRLWQDASAAACETRPDQEVKA